jgi:hypothetical protein
MTLGDRVPPVAYASNVPKRSLLAIVCLALAIAAPVSSFIFAGLMQVFIRPTSPSTALFLSANFGFLVTPAIALAAFGIGVAALIRIRRSRTSLRGKGLAISGMFVGAGWVSLLIGIMVSNRISDREYEKRVAQQRVGVSGCKQNLEYLAGYLLFAYAQDHGDRFPPTANWSDALAAVHFVDSTRFRCPNDPTGPSSYAFNANLEGLKRSEVPADTVVFFEAGPGWNLHGGFESACTGRHQSELGNGCLVAFCDGTRFVRADDLARLRWDPRSSIRTSGRPGVRENSSAMPGP